jgi:hypothetical protein
MSFQIIKGTWEEIKQRESELAGRQVRLIIRTDSPTHRVVRKSESAQDTNAQPKRLVGYGAFKDALPDSESYMREKQEELDREERRR